MDRDSVGRDSPGPAPADPLGPPLPRFMLGGDRGGVKGAARLWSRDLKRTPPEPQASRPAFPVLPLTPGVVAGILGGLGLAGGLLFAAGVMLGLNLQLGAPPPAPATPSATPSAVVSPEVERPRAPTAAPPVEREDVSRPESPPAPRIAEEPPPVPPPAPVSTAPPPAPVSAAPPSVPVPVAPPPVPVSAAPPPVSVAPLPASVPTASEMTALQEPEAREPESPKPVSTEVPKPASAEIPKPVPAEIKDVQSPIPEPPAPPASPPPAIKPPVGVASARDGRYTVQVGAFRSPDNARSLSQRLISAGFPANVASVPSRKGGTLHRVYIGRFVNHAKADPVQAAVRARGFDAIVVTLD